MYVITKSSLLRYNKSLECTIVLKYGDIPQKVISFSFIQSHGKTTRKCQKLLSQHSPSFRLGKWKICPTYRRQMPRDQRTHRQERRYFFGQIICHTGKRGEANERVLRKSTFFPIPFFRKIEKVSAFHGKRRGFDRNFGDVGSP